MNNNKSWSEVLKDYGDKTLDSKKTWYGAVAVAYNRVRPRYPQEIISRAIALTQLSDSANILELGCGPGIATVQFAQMGFSLLSLEPNREASELAQQNCAEYSHVKILNTSFEEWELEKERFEAVLAATSWHWIDPAIAYSKSVAALKPNGHLILLWNTPPQLDFEAYRSVDHVYQMLAPSVPVYARYEDQDTHQEHFQEFSRNIANSECFDNLHYGSSVCTANYSLDDYLLLLSTLSPYIALNENERNNLFAKLKEVLNSNFGDRLTLHYISAFHTAHKI